MVSSKASFYFVQVKKNTLLVGILLYGQPLSVYGGIFLLILGGGVPTKKNLILTKGYSVNIRLHLFIADLCLLAISVFLVSITTA